MRGKGISCWVLGRRHVVVAGVPLARLVFGLSAVHNGTFVPCSTDFTCLRGLRGLRLRRFLREAIHARARFSNP